MIVRLLFVLFISGASGIAYLAGYSRLMTGLLVGFGGIVSFFFGLLFVVEPSHRELWFPVYGVGSPWPFFLLGCVLIGMGAFFYLKKQHPASYEKVTGAHFLYCLWGFLLMLASVFLPTLLWAPSEAARISLGPDRLYIYALAGTLIYLAGTVAALALFYRAAKGAAPKYPDLMRRLVLALFSIVHFDKLPAFIAFLLIYSPESKIIYPSLAALSLAGYIPVAWFLLALTHQSSPAEEIWKED